MLLGVSVTTIPLGYIQVVGEARFLKVSNIDFYDLMIHVYVLYKKQKGRKENCYKILDTMVNISTELVYL